MNEYAAKLGDVLRTFDPNQMRAFIEEHRSMYRVIPDLIKNDEFVLGTMAKLICSRTDMDEATIARAYDILDDLGWDDEIY